MGWTIGWDTKDNVIRELLDDSKCDGKIVDSHLAGNELWTVIRLKDQSRVIVLFLLEQHGRWGYKSMDEGMGPYFYKCPLSFLEQAPVASESWRERVREYHMQVIESLASECECPPVEADITLDAVMDCIDDLEAENV